MKKLLVLTLSLLLVVAMLFGCGAKSESMVGNSAAPDRYDGSLGYYDSGSGGDYESKENISTDTSASIISTETVMQKLVRKMWINAETEDLDALLQQVDEKMASLGGYAEKREVYNGSPSASRRYRRATITVRVPAEQLNQFTDAVTGLSNVTSCTESADDITLSYVAIESRIEVLESEESALLTMLAKAENISDMLAIRKQLEGVQGELASLRAQKRVYDDQVAYSTVNMTVREVKRVSEETETMTFGQEIGYTFMESLYVIGSFFRGASIFLIGHSPVLLLWAALIVGIVLLVRHLLRKKKQATSKDDHKD
jgi:hypothetical protein